MSLEPQRRAQRKLIAAARTSARHLPPALPPALFLTDPVRTPDPFAIACRLPAGFGVVYRHFGAPDREVAARRLAGICARRRLAFLIAADPELAAKVGADGVHWPFRLRHEARRWRSRFRLQTVSAHDRRELGLAGALPVDAALLSAVFASASPTAGTPMGAIRFARMTRATRKPVYALGGVTANNLRLVSRFGGFAAVEGLTPFERIRT